MKTSILVLLTFLACAATLSAQTVAGTQLEIGPAGSNQVSDTYQIKGGAIGTGNNVNGDGSLAVGQYNQLWSGFAVGELNNLDGGVAAFGYNNTNNGNSCVAIGAQNQMVGDGEYGRSYASLSVGQLNYLSEVASSSISVGTNNLVGVSDLTGYSEAVESSATVGHGLINSWNYSIILGCYNDARIGSGLLFAIGNGSDPTHRSNALEVYADGKIKMPRQGDILMGEFGNTGD